jgi:FHS family L-fucose permease-like MFS transporter
LSAILQRASAVRVLMTSIGIATLASLVLVTTRSVSVGGASVFVLGAGFAAMFPVMFAVIGNRYAQLSGTALSLAMSMALTGGMLLPYLTGVLATARGLRASFLIIPVGLVLLATALTILSRRVAPKAFATDQIPHTLESTTSSGGR